MIDLRVNGQVVPDVELVIFDKDGTLIDIHHYWCSMLTMRARILIEAIKPDDPEKAFIQIVEAMGVNTQAQKIKPEGPVGIKPRSIIEQTALEECSKFSPEVSLETVKSIFLEVDRLSSIHIANFVKILPGVYDLVENLFAQKIKLAIATTDLSSRAKLAMQTIRMDSFFSVIAGGDNVAKTKPSPEVVFNILGALSVKPDKALLIGDSIVDLETAANAGIRFVGVKTGLHEPVFLEKTTYLINQLNEIKVNR